MDYQSPLIIHVVWHPDFQDGKRYADLIYKTFNRDTEFALQRNLSIPVFYRSQSDIETGVPIPIRYDEARRNAVVILVDDHLMLSDSWADFVKNEVFDKIASNPNNRIYPVAISKNAYRLANGSLATLQFVRLNEVEISDKEIEFEQRWRLMRSRLLHDLCRLMYKIGPVSGTVENKPESGYNALPNPPVKLFISHAKADGLPIAKKILHYIQQDTSLNAFFDARDIAGAYRFDKQILEQFDENSAIIAVVTDAFATREWCRLEVSTAKRKKCSLVVINHLTKGEIRSFPYLGNVPSIKGIENLQDVIDLTLIQVLNTRFANESLDNHLKLYGLDKQYQCMIFGSPPELFNYLDILAEDKKDKKIGLVIYPDPPLGEEEQAILSEIMPDVHFTTPTHSYRHLR